VNRSNEDLAPCKETVSQYGKTDFSEKRERRSGGKDLDLPARSRFGEGRAATFNRSDLDVPGYKNTQSYTIGDFPQSKRPAF